jgi:hypothetical protein
MGVRAAPFASQAQAPRSGTPRSRFTSRKRPRQQSDDEKSLNLPSNLTPPGGSPISAAQKKHLNP